MTKRVLPFLLILLCGLSMFFLGCRRTPSENRVALFANITAIEPVLEDFTDKTGLQVDYTRLSTTAFLATVFTEFEANRLMADVLQAPLPIMELMAARGMLAPYTSPSAAGFPDWARRGGTDGIYLFAIEYVSIIYNHNLIDSAEVPTSFMGLTDPVWRNRIVMPNPSIHATTISWLVALKYHHFDNDETAWRAFLEGLAANNPMFVASFGPTPAPIASGERPIGISMPKYIVTHAPAPLSWAQIEPVLGTSRGIGISSRAPNPEGARAFIDHWLSAEAGRILADDVGEYVLVPGVFPPIAGMDTAVVLPIADLSDEEIMRWSAEFRTIFGI